MIYWFKRSKRKYTVKIRIEKINEVVTSRLISAFNIDNRNTDVTLSRSWLQGSSMKAYYTVSNTFSRRSLFIYFFPTYPCISVYKDNMDYGHRWFRLYSGNVSGLSMQNECTLSFVRMYRFDSVYLQYT